VESGGRSQSDLITKLASISLARLQTGKPAVRRHQQRDDSCGREFQWISRPVASAWRNSVKSAPSRQAANSESLLSCPMQRASRHDSCTRQYRQLESHKLASNRYNQTNIDTYQPNECTCLPSTKICIQQQLQANAEVNLASG
jgi:hypothetical protein